MRVIILSLAALLTLAACKSSSPADPPARYVATAVGRVDSQQEARRLVATVDGVIEDVRVTRGERVSAGQVLMQVACAPRRAQAESRSAQALQAAAASQTISDGSRPEELAVARAALAAAESRRTDAASNLARAQRLSEQGFLAAQGLESRQNELAVAAAEADEARAKLALAEAGPRRTERAGARSAAKAAQAEAEAANALSSECALRSPVAGSVLQILRQAGEFSGASQGVPLVVVGDLSKLMVRAEINERDAGQVRKGQAVDIWVEGAPEHWRGRIASLADLMGRRSARSLDPTDRFDRDVR
ncbi:MAG TPA: efflux RND transporter periplasmic adaptor subunit, partial [Phenylobacterium sp.]|nr:efflux RND transporter periplasmic adaptor subunit [Phenylobacterium sp.]